MKLNFKFLFFLVDSKTSERTFHIKRCGLKILLEKISCEPVETSCEKLPLKISWQRRCRTFSSPGASTRKHRNSHLCLKKVGKKFHTCIDASFQLQMNGTGLLVLNCLQLKNFSYREAPQGFSLPISSLNISAFYR